MADPFEYKWTKTNSYFAGLPTRQKKSKEFTDMYCQADNKTLLKPDVHKRLFSLGYEIEACCWRHEFILCVPKLLTKEDMKVISEKIQIPAEHLNQKLQIPDINESDSTKQYHKKQLTEQLIGWWEG